MEQYLFYLPGLMLLAFAIFAVFRHFALMRRKERERQEALYKQCVESIDRIVKRQNELRKEQSNQGSARGDAIDEKIRNTLHGKSATPFGIVSSRPSPVNSATPNEGRIDRASVAGASRSGDNKFRGSTFDDARKRARDDDDGYTNNPLLNPAHPLYPAHHPSTPSEPAVSSPSPSSSHSHCAPSHSHSSHDASSHSHSSYSSSSCDSGSSYSGSDSSSSSFSSSD